MKTMPQEIQLEILDILESERREELIKASKVKQARLIVQLKKKYDFEKRSLGMN
ncbi:hypothetical protein [Parvicella tangerina]|uniref:Uncharacterized protein n=1 Tax=Parvicella tangerina TaxID=2829795 RepID=A0A916JRD3_9FLAO|nr:hypothetical protein [Parvicella tangerina]CAG5087809.1 hypothetical protein CRYO30217_03587 [Parvicella tangerina]